MWRFLWEKKIPMNFIGIILANDDVAQVLDDVHYRFAKHVQVFVQDDFADIVVFVVCDDDEQPLGVGECGDIREYYSHARLAHFVLDDNCVAYGCSLGRSNNRH